MGIIPSLIVVAVGAILDFAITVTNTHGFNLHTIGVILMVVGGIGFVLSLVFWGTWGGFRRTGAIATGGAVISHRETVTEQREVL
jgi:hypothetical protein